MYVQILFTLGLLAILMEWDLSRRRQKNTFFLGQKVWYKSAISGTYFPADVVGVGSEEFLVTPHGWDVPQVVHRSRVKARLAVRV